MKSNNIFSNPIPRITAYFQGNKIKTIKLEMPENKWETGGNWVEKGLAYYKQGEYDKTIEAFNKAIAIDPNNEYAWFGKGQVFVKLGECIKAIEAFNKAIAINSNDGLALGSKEIVFAIKQLKNLGCV